MNEDAKPVKPKRDYHLNKQERAALLAATELLICVFNIKPETMPEFFIKAAHDLALIFKEQEHCTCTGCENRRKAEKASHN